jgi:hypothetical protein
MKKTFQITGLLVIIATMIYNLNISTTKNDQEISLAYLRNTAQADEEDNKKYKESSTASGTYSHTYTNQDGTTCTESGNFTKTDCTGTGNTDCTPSYSTSNVKKEGSCL